jgi:hypothetical protein
VVARCASPGPYGRVRAGDLLLPFRTIAVERGRALPYGRGCVARRDGGWGLLGGIRFESLLNGGMMLKVVLAREDVVLVCSRGNPEVVELAAGE